MRCQSLRGVGYNSQNAQEELMFTLKSQGSQGQIRVKGFR